METNTRKALSGVKVVELSESISGPYCAKVLADLGAEVIKIEKLNVGDKVRSRGPFVDNKAHPEHSIFFLYLNTNKLGITLDIFSPLGRQQFTELIK